jgi:dihydrolipoamide dehydrogenase
MAAYDLAVLGAGPGGYVAALRAAQLGAKVCLIEKGPVGGTCLNRGCIPTKALITSADLWRKVQGAGPFGVELAEARFNLARAVARKDEVVAHQVKGLLGLLRGAKIELVEGEGAFADPGTIHVGLRAGGEADVSAGAFIVATGSEPAHLPAAPVDGQRIITSDEALGLSALPASALVIGGGVVGMEFASYWAALGVRVTVVEMLPQLLPTEDPRIAKGLEAILIKQGVTFHVGAKLERSEVRGDGVHGWLSTGAEVVADLALVAVGRALNSRGIGLERAGVALDRHAVRTDERMATSVPHIYAAGDVAGKVLLAHSASAEGLVAAANALGRPASMDYTAVPNCIFTFPEIASVGQTEAQAKAAGLQVRVGRFNFAASGKALCLGEPEGFIQVVADASSDRLLGVQMLGPHVTDLIAEAGLAIRRGIPAREVAGTIHAHPTLPEAFMEAVHDVHGEAIHKLRLRAGG